MYDFKVSDATGWASTLVYVNLPPAPGKCVVTPSTGYAVETKFSVQCSGWTDETDTELGYVFNAKPCNQMQVQPTMIRALSPSNSHAFVVPAGVAGSDNLVCLLTTVCDASNACSNTATTITMNMKVVSQADLDSAADPAALVSAMGLGGNTMTDLANAGKQSNAGGMTALATGVASGMAAAVNTAPTASPIAGRRLLQQSSVDGLGGQLRSFLMGAITDSIGVNVITTDNVRESVQALAAVAALGFADETTLDTALGSLKQLAGTHHPQPRPMCIACAVPTVSRPA